VLSRTVDLAQEPARLVYGLTLDTHLPLSAPQAQMPSELKVACARAAAPESACRLVQQLGLVLDELEQRLAASPATPFVAIAGDHSPPFGETANRDVFEAAQVPVFLLRPRSSGDR
jgi:hypothetical protein